FSIITYYWESKKPTGNNHNNYKAVTKLEHKDHTIVIASDEDYIYYMTLGVLKGVKTFSFALLLPFLFITFILFLIERKSIPKWKSEKRKKIFKVIFRIIWLITLITFLVLIIFSIITYYWESKKPTGNNHNSYKAVTKSSRQITQTLANPSSGESDNLPDLDLHLYCDDGRHIGMNYETGEYEVDIPDAIVSGDNQNAPEWIFIPKDITNCHYVVSSYDNQKFLEENPEVAQQIEDTTDNYEIYGRYIDPETDIYTSQTISEQIDIGENKQQFVAGTKNISVAPSVLISVKGDVNGDCKVDVLDLVSVRNKLNQDPNIPTNKKADVNKDGRINVLDLILVRNNLGKTCSLSKKDWPLPADVNLDCKVDILDLIFIRNHLNQDPSTDIEIQRCDVNTDGRINVLDLVFARNHLNETCE
ncbi:MAG: dockerin type I domain-containing protein, partial [Candidatus Heimdallarchaeaceae archaeon]